MVCGTFCSAFESTSHVSRNKVIGKLKYLIGPVSGTTPHPLLDLVQDVHNMRLQSGWTL